MCLIKLANNSWGMAFHMLTKTATSFLGVSGTFGKRTIRGFIVSQTCSISDMLGETAGQGRTWAVAWYKSDNSTGNVDIGDVDGH